MKHLKTKLMAAIVMLCISTIMLTGVSFAWYTLSTNPEVTNIKASVAANENLEIALDNGYASEDKVDEASQYGGTTAQGSTTGNPYTWGNLIDLNTAMTTMNPNEGSETAPKIVLAPVKYIEASHTLNFPKYGLDGRVSTTNNEFTSVNVTDHSSVTTALGGVTGYKQDEDTSTVYDAFSVTYWIRSNEDCEVSLSTAEERAYSKNDSDAAETDVNGVKGKGSYIELKVSDKNTATVLDKYAKNLVIRFDVYSASGTYEKSTYCKLDASDQTSATEGYRRYTATMINQLNSITDPAATAATIDLDANDAKKIQMLVYIDGESLKNEDALLEDCAITMNIQFKSDVLSEDDAQGAINGTTN